MDTIKKILLVCLLLCGVAYGRGTPIVPYFSDYIYTMLDDPDAATARTTLGLGLGDSPTFAGETITGSAVFGLNSAVFKPTTNSMTFLQVKNADGTVVPLNVDTSNKRVGIGGTNPSYRLSVFSSDATQQLGIYHDYSNAYFRTSQGSFIFLTDVGTNTDTTVKVQGKGTGIGFLQYFDEDNAEYMSFYCAGGIGYAGVYGTSPQRLSFQGDSEIPIRMFEYAAAGETKELQLYGFRTGDASRSLQIGVGVDANNTASFDGVSNYFFNGSIRLGTANFGTGSPAGILSMKSGTHPTAPAADCAVFFVEDVVVGTAEMRVMDEATNETTLSSHAFPLFQPDLSYEYPWSFHATNAVLGKEINVDMYGAILAIEKLAQKKFIYTRDIPKEDWKVQQTQLLKERELQEEIEISLDESVEDYEITEEGTIGYEEKYRFDPNTAVVIKYSSPIIGQVPTGKFSKKLKVGVRVDEITGKIYRKKRLDEIVIDSSKFVQMPDWMKSKVNQ